MQRYIPHAGDGWALALEAIDEGRGERVPRAAARPRGGHRAHARGARRRSRGPRFAPEEPSEEHIALISATIDEQIERSFIELPELEALAPIDGRSEELRDRAAKLSHRAPGGG